MPSETRIVKADRTDREIKSPLKKVLMRDSHGLAAPVLRVPKPDTASLVFLLCIPIHPRIHIILITSLNRTSHLSIEHLGK